VKAEDTIVEFIELVFLDYSFVKLESEGILVGCDDGRVRLHLKES